MPFPAVTEPMAGVVDLIDWLKVPHMLKTSSTFGVHTLFTLELPLAVSPPYLTHKKNVLARGAGISVERGAGSNRPYPYVAHPWGCAKCYLYHSENTFTSSSHHW